MRKQRASQDTGKETWSWPGKETWSWHQILWCSDEHLAAFLQLGRRRLTDIYLSTFTDLSSFQAGVTEIKEVCHRDPAALRHCLRSRAMHDALASHRQRLRLAGPGRRPCGSTVRGGDTGRNGSNSSWSQRRNHGGGAAPRTRGTMTAPVARLYREGGGNPKGGSRERGAVPKVHLGASYRNRPARVHPAARSAAPAGEAERRRPTSQTGPDGAFPPPPES